jgi:hypothetical protein
MGPQETALRIRRSREPVKRSLPAIGKVSKVSKVSKISKVSLLVS